MAREAPSTVTAADFEDAPLIPWRRVGVAAAVALVGAAVWFLMPSRASRLASRTIAMQEKLLAAAAEPATRRQAVEEIMRNVDKLPPDEIRRVRDALFEQINEIRLESLERFAAATADERTALLDEDLGRIRLVRGLLDATDQGGMRPFTEKELRDREERRRQQAEGQKKPPTPAKTAKRESRPRRATVDQKQVAEYMEALTKRAKEKNVDLGRMFSRPPGRG